jgi:RNA polymerase sigma-70 factor (ECF subfamily)
MYNTAVRILQDSEDARDVLQDAFIDMYTKLDSFREESTFGAWFKRIVVNKSLNHIKKARPQTLDYEDVDIEYENEPYSEPFSHSVNDVQRAMKELPHGYKLVFDLYMFEGYSHKEIASYLGITEATSKSQLSRAKVKIRELLNHQND